MKRLKKAVSWLVIAFFAVLICFPIFFAVTGAFSAQWELTDALGPVLGSGDGTATWSLLPKAPTLLPLIGLLMDTPQFFAMFWNSIKLSGCILVGQIVFGMPAAWSLARYDFPGKRIVLMIYIILMLMPFQVLMLPQYLVVHQLGLLDSHWAVILPAVFSTFPVFIMYRFFRGIPKGIFEAARIDGAGDIKIFRYMGIPLGAPGVVSAGILGFLDSWNMVEQPMTFLKTKSLWPLSLFLPEIGLSEVSAGFVAALMMLVPALLIFLSGQEYLEQGIATAALKE